MPFDFISNLLKARKNEKRPAPAAEAPTPEAPAAEPAAAQLGAITESQIGALLQKPDRPAATLRVVMDETAYRLIAKGDEPHLSFGEMVQQLREELTTDESPFMDFDAALIAAIEQLENICNSVEQEAEAVRQTTRTMLAEIFEGRKAGTPATRREAFQLKGYYLQAQLIAQQGQLLESKATIARYSRQLARLQSNAALDPTGMQVSQIKWILEHARQMQELLYGNISTLQSSIIATQSAVHQAEAAIISPKDALQSTVETMNRQNQVYQEYLRELSDASELLKVMSNSTMEIAAQERATMQALAQSQRQMDMERALRRKQEPGAAHTPGEKIVPAPVENPAVSCVEEDEAPVQDALPMNFLDF